MESNLEILLLACVVCTDEGSLLTGHFTTFLAIGLLVSSQSLIPFIPPEPLCVFQPIESLLYTESDAETVP